MFIANIDRKMTVLRVTTRSKYMHYFDTDRWGALKDFIFNIIKSLILNLAF